MEQFAKKVSDSDLSELRYLFLDVLEGGSSTVVLDESALRDRGIIALHVCAGAVYALLADDMKLHRLDEVRGLPSRSADKVRPIKTV